MPEQGLGNMLALLTILLGVLVLGAIARLVLHDVLLTRLRGRHPALNRPEREYEEEEEGAAPAEGRAAALVQG